MHSICMEVRRGWRLRRQKWRVSQLYGGHVSQRFLQVQVIRKVHTRGRWQFEQLLAKSQCPEDVAHLWNGKSIWLQNQRPYVQFVSVRHPRVQTALMGTWLESEKDCDWAKYWPHNHFLCWPKETWPLNSSAPCTIIYDACSCEH